MVVTEQHESLEMLQALQWVVLRGSITSPRGFTSCQSCDSASAACIEGVQLWSLFATQCNWRDTSQAEQ